MSGVVDTVATTPGLLARLQRHYIKPGADLPGGVFVPEVGVNGPGRQTRCDAIYVGFTSTSGRRFVGHELKVSKADWRHELDLSGKADFWHDNTHQWYVVAPSTSIVEPDTLPEGWGLMVPSTRTTTRMDIVVKAADRGITPSWHAVRSVIARQDTLRAEAIFKAKQKIDQDARDRIAKVQDDARLAGLGMQSEQAQRLARLVREVETRARSQNVWATATDDEIIQAILDQVAARDAARKVLDRLRNLVRHAEQIADPFGSLPRHLVALVKDAEAVAS